MKLVIQNMSRVWGGNEKWLSILASGLGARGHSVIVSCPRGPVRDRLVDLGIATTSFRPRGVIDPVSGLSFAAWLALRRPDAVLMTSWHSIAWTTSAARLARVPRVVLRNGIVRRAPSSGVRYRALRSGVDALIVNSPEIRDVWIESAPWFNPGDVHVVFNAIESRANDRDSSRSRLRAEIGAAESTLVIGSSGNLFKRKGFDLLLRSIARAAIGDSLLVIIGEGEERRALERLADQLGIRASVRFLGQRTDGPDLLGGLDIFVLASRNEGMANVMLEAMSFGVPVVASSISGVETAIGASGQRGPAGWIVREQGEEAFAAVISEVAAAVRATSPEVSERTSEALWRIDTWFAHERMITECEKVLFER